MELLNAEPTKTLPQNPRNAIWEETPDGLDRRIKKSLNTNTRHADIISEVLEKAGVVGITQIKSPQSGRLIKGTRLLKAWHW